MVQKMLSGLSAMFSLLGDVFVFMVFGPGSCHISGDDARHSSVWFQVRHGVVLQNSRAHPKLICSTGWEHTLKL